MDQRPFNAEHERRISDAESRLTVLETRHSDLRSDVREIKHELRALAKEISSKVAIGASGGGVVAVIAYALYEMVGR